MMVYDPVLGQQERTALEQLGCENISENEVIIMETYGYIIPYCIIIMVS